MSTRKFIGIAGLVLTAMLLAGAPVRAESEGIDLQASAPPRFLWKRQFNTAAHEVANGVAADPNGNIILRGYSGTSWDWGTSWNWVAKLNPSADTLWWIHLLPVGDGRGVTTDADGNVIAAGLSAPRGESPNPQHFLWKLVKYSPAGAVLWEREYKLTAGPYQAAGSVLRELPVSVTTDKSTDIIVGIVVWNYCGYSGGQCGPQQKSLIAKIDPSGGLKWSVSLFEGYNRDVLAGLATDSDGNIVVTGTSYVAPIESHGYMVPWIGKLYPDGYPFWWQIPENSGDKEAAGIAVGPTGKIVVAGRQYKSGINYDWGGPQWYSDGGWIIAYGPNGDQRWDRRLIDPPEAVATDESDNTLVCGDRPYLDKEAQDVSDGWVTKRDAEGGFLWKRRLRTSETDEAIGITADLEGNVIVTGSTQGSLAAPNGGGSDIWLVKLRP